MELFDQNLGTFVQKIWNFLISLASQSLRRKVETFRLQSGYVSTDKYKRFYYHSGNVSARKYIRFYFQVHTFPLVCVLPKLGQVFFSPRKETQGKNALRRRYTPLRRKAALRKKSKLRQTPDFTKAGSWMKSPASFACETR